MREKTNDIIGIIVAGILTSLVFNIKLVPPEIKTIDLKNIIGVSTLSQEELRKLIYASQRQEKGKSINIKKRNKYVKKTKAKLRKTSSKRKKYKSSKNTKKRTYLAKKTKLAKAKTYNKLKLKQKKRTEEKILKKSIFLPLSENESSNLEGIKIPLTYLESLKEIIKSNFFYPKEALKKKYSRGCGC